jgi:hypothetical protein
LERILLEKIEVRAFGCLLEDLLMHCQDEEVEKEVEVENHATSSTVAESTTVFSYSNGVAIESNHNHKSLKEQLEALQEQCLRLDSLQRPSFQEIDELFQQLTLSSSSSVK